MLNHGMKKLIILFTFAFMFAGCATDGGLNPSAPTGYPINGQSSIQLSTEFKFMPSLSGYYLPAGVYQAESEDAEGVFFKAPKGARSLSLTGSIEVEGGIFLPKQGGRDVRGYVYLILPVVGRLTYFLPDQFFAAYGKSWAILDVEFGAYLIKGKKLNGLYDGPVEIWTSPTARQMAGKFSRGNPVGSWTFWDSKGTRIATLEYADGIQSGSVEMWYGSFAYPEDAGKLKLRGVLRGGRWDGSVTSYYRNGQIHSERTYEKGVLVRTVSYDDDGKALTPDQSRQQGEQDDRADETYLAGLDLNLRDSAKYAQQAP